jgi:hypothetical protein
MLLLQTEWLWSMELVCRYEISPCCVIQHCETLKCIYSISGLQTAVDRGRYCLLSSRVLHFQEALSNAGTTIPNKDMCTNRFMSLLHCNNFVLRTVSHSPQAFLLITNKKQGSWKNKTSYILLLLNDYTEPKHTELLLVPLLNCLLRNKASWVICWFI